MATKEVIKLQHRDSTGKGPARTLRREGMLPGVVYGEGFQTVSVTANLKELQVAYRQGGSHEIMKAQVEGEKASFDVIIKNIQVNPVTRHIIHFDLLKIRADKEMTVSIPVVLEGIAAGVKEMGGILQHGLREIEVTCLPKDLPESVTVNVASLAIHDSIHVRDLVLPQGVEVNDNPDDLIVSVLPPVVMKLEAELEQPETASPQADTEKKAPEKKAPEKKAPEKKGSEGKA